MDYNYIRFIFWKNEGDEMGIYRLGIGCILIVSIIAYLFFSEKRKKTKMHRMYGALIVTAWLHLVAELGAIYTLTHMDTVKPWVNRGMHQIFLILFLVIFYEVYLYIVAMIEEETVDGIRENRWILVPFGIAAVGVMILPIYYENTSAGSYSYGPGVMVIYVSVCICAVAAVTYMVRSRKILSEKKKKAIAIALACELGVGIYQFFNPTCLLSSVGVTILCIGFYLTVESPDNALIELLLDEKKKVEAAKEEAVMANRAKDRFLAQMSHEIRTPINAILGMDEMILRESKEANVVEYAEDINAASQLLLSIVNEILDLSKIESGKMEIVNAQYNFCSMVEDLTTMIAVKTQSKELAFKVNMDTSLPVVLYGDDVRIRQVLTNLLTNAVKYTKEGTISFDITGETQGDEVLLRFSVKDTGIGIKEEHIANLFDEYKRIEEASNRYVEGTGLGLNITIRLLEMMNSKLQVKSVYGEGSDFYFELRQEIREHLTVDEYQKQHTNAKEKSKWKSAFVAPKARFLIVDDNMMNRKVFAKLLRHTKITIDEAESGFACIEKVQENYYDIIFLDHMMPELDGVETLQRMKEMRDYPCENTPVVALTANAIVGAKKQYISEGFDDFLPKPIIYRDAEELILKFLPSHLVEHLQDMQES